VGRGESFWLDQRYTASLQPNQRTKKKKKKKKKKRTQKPGTEKEGETVSNENENDDDNDDDNDDEEEEEEEVEEGGHEEKEEDDMRLLTLSVREAEVRLERKQPLANYEPWALPCSYLAPSDGPTAGTLPSLPLKLLQDPLLHRHRTRGPNKRSEQQKDTEREMAVVTLPRFARRFHVMHSRHKRAAHAQSSGMSTTATTTTTLVTAKAARGTAVGPAHLEPDESALVDGMRYHLEMLYQRNEVTPEGYARLVAQMEKALPVGQEQHRARVVRLRNCIRQGQKRRDDRLFDELKANNDRVSKRLVDSYWERTVRERSTGRPLDDEGTSGSDDDNNDADDDDNNDADDNDTDAEDADEDNHGENSDTSGDGRRGQKGSARVPSCTGANSSSSRLRARRTSRVSRASRVSSKRSSGRCTSNGGGSMGLGVRGTTAGYEVVNTRVQLDRDDPNNPKNRAQAAAREAVRRTGHAHHEKKEEDKRKRDWDTEQAALIEEQRVEMDNFKKAEEESAKAENLVLTVQRKHRSSMTSKAKTARHRANLRRAEGLVRWYVSTSAYSHPFTFTHARTCALHTPACLPYASRAFASFE
jgi:hypothetical protein